MTQVANRSSDSGSSVSQPPVFDLTNEHDLLLLLRNIHRGQLKQSVKNELRNMLFVLTQDGAAADHEGIVNALATVGFAATYGTHGAASAVEIASSGPTETAVAPTDVPSTTNTRTLGRARQQPRFAPLPTGPSIPAPEPKAVTKSPKLTEVSETNAVSDALADHQVSAPHIESDAAPTEVPPRSEPAEPSVQSAVDAGDSLTRIKEIKRLINEKVGNPVALIDLDNRVGRTYMNALLAAMKAVNGGAADELASAMTQLEMAFSEAMKIADQPLAAAEKEPVIPSETPTPTSEPTATVTPQPLSDDVVASDSVAAEEVATEVQEEVVPKPAGNPVAIHVTRAADNQDVSPKNVIKASIGDTVKPLRSAAMGIAPTVPPETTSVTEVAETEAVPSEPTSATATEPAPATADASPEVESGRLMSVAKEEQLQNLLRQNKAAEAAGTATSEPVSGDPLMAPEVTAGLKQLLSEWGLFKSSGFFGTGPGGIDHPLYKQMSQLTMAAVIAGRFEGATSQIKQSVTDYMNGWRYEEGILHEHSETFEHYLRRVIRHILNAKPMKVDE